MKIDLESFKLPPVYMRNGKPCYLDPIREKLICVKPEETVRQKVIAYLLERLKVPSYAIKVEEHLSHYGVKSKRAADIIVNSTDENGNLVPILIVECKAPYVMIGDKETEQAFDYADGVLCNYAAVTNGTDLFVYRHVEEKNGYIPIEELPPYLDMLENKYTEAVTETLPPRLTFDEIFTNEEYIDIGVIGESVKKEMLPCLVNLWECFLYTEHKLPAKQYKLFKVIEDIGIRYLTYGNPSGGYFEGAYRSFITEYKSSTEIVSFSFTPYMTYSNRKDERTCICVAIDNEETSHHALQYVADDNLVIDGEKCIFYHSGRIAVGNIGSGKIEGLREAVKEQYPQIIDEKKFCLGTLTNDRLWNLDDEEVISFVENLISYALIRDEYRKKVKQMQ